MTEQLPFELISREPGFEIRHYPKHLQIQVQISGEFSAAANQAFSPLVNYISGNNSTKAKFAMTAPVLHAPGATLHTVSFVLPAGLNFTDLPIPSNTKVKTIEVPAHFSAVRAFRGLASYQHFSRYGDQLLLDVTLAGLKPTGETYYARFDPPWKPGFLRRNEALIDLTEYPSKGKK